MTDFDTLDYFTDPSLVPDPYPYLDHLRERCPVTSLPHHGVVAVTGIDEAQAVLRDPTTFSSCAAVSGPFPGFRTTAPVGDDIGAFIDQHRHELPMADYLVTQDPPQHTAERGLLMRLMTPKRMKENEEFMGRLATRQIDGFVGRGRFELLHDFARPFTLLVIADLLGVPEDDHREFAMQLGASHPEPSVGGARDRAVSPDPLRFLLDQFSAYVVDRRRRPRNDVLTELATATYPDGSTPEVIAVARTAAFLFAAGQDTTARLLGSALRIIGERPELQDQLRDDPARIPDFIEEVLRVESVVKSMFRIARTASTVSGVDIPMGTMVLIAPGAANRDPRRFDRPGEFDLDRPNARDHISFGRGIHSCPGGALARIEARVSLEHLLARLDEITISEAEHGPADDRHYSYLPTYILRGLESLHLEFTPTGP